MSELPLVSDYTHGAVPYLCSLLDCPAGDTEFFAGFPAPFRVQSTVVGTCDFETAGTASTEGGGRGAKRPCCWVTQEGVLPADALLGRAIVDIGILCHQPRATPESDVAPEPFLGFIGAPHQPDMICTFGACSGAGSGWTQCHPCEG